MQVKNPSNGKMYNVTKKAFENVYKALGFVEVGGEQDDQGKNVGENSNPAALTKERYDEIMRNKENVVSALFYYGNDVEFSPDKMKADELRSLLKETLAAKGLLPSGD